MHFLSVLTDRVHQPLASVRVASPFTRCAEELRTFVLLFCTILQRFVNFERIFLCEPWVMFLFQARCRLQAAMFVENRVTYPRPVLTIPEACIHLVSIDNFLSLKTDHPSLFVLVVVAVFFGGGGENMFTWIRNHMGQWNDQCYGASSTSNWC